MEVIEEEQGIEAEAEHEDSKPEPLEAKEEKEDLPAPVLKELPKHLRYEFLDSTNRFLVIVASKLTERKTDQ